MIAGLRIIVTGLIAQYPLGGLAWDYVQYPAGLAALGHDVYYFEDTGQWPYNPHQGGISDTADYNAEYLSKVMTNFGLGDRWAYRFPRGPRWYGLSDSRRRNIVNSADLLINVSGTLAQPAQYAAGALLVYVDSDPVFTQLKLRRGQRDFRALIDQHDVFFTFGENVADNPSLATGHDWRPTRQPILLDAWRTREQPRSAFTTVMNWSSYKPITFEGKTYGQKDVEFKKLMDLPDRVSPVVLEVAMAAGKDAGAPVDLLRHRKWQIVDPNTVCPDLESYRGYLRGSHAEFAVAKNGYVVGQAGWFSCRSACYLASGRPVVVQDTGLDGVLPLGDGIAAFRDLDGAIAAIEDVNRRYDTHRRAAFEIAEAHFDSKLILDALIATAFSGSAATSPIGSSQP